jgi:hypothetical protein
MPYTFSTGQVASGSSISINTGTISTPVWLPIEECMSVDPSGIEVKTVNATNLQSTVAEVLPTLPDPGTVKVSAIRVPAATGQAAVLTQFNLGAAQAPVEFKIQLSKDAAAGQTSTGDSMMAACYVTQCISMSGIGPEKIVMFEFTLKAVTNWTQTAGS